MRPIGPGHFTRTRRPAISEAIAASRSWLAIRSWRSTSHQPGRPTPTTTSRALTQTGVRAAAVRTISPSVREARHDGAELERDHAGALDLGTRERLRALAVDLHQGPAAAAQLERDHQHRADPQPRQLGELGRIAERVAGHDLAGLAGRDEVRGGREVLQQPGLAR